MRRGLSMYCFAQGWTVVVARVSGEVSMYCFTQGWLYLRQVTGRLFRSFCHVPLRWGWLRVLLVVPESLPGIMYCFTQG